MIKKDVWTYRFIILLGFLLFDLTTTLVSISSPSQEGNALARTSMMHFGTHFGLVLFGFFIVTFLVIILWFCKFLFSGKDKWTFFVGIFVVDVSLGWFIAGVHFVGATSWFCFSSEFLRHCLGTSIYFLTLYLLIANRIRRRAIITAT